ncbi:hypothetical protein BGZ65_011328, partial [Modicella reniformis]
FPDPASTTSSSTTTTSSATTTTTTTTTPTPTTTTTTTTTPTPTTTTTTTTTTPTPTTTTSTISLIPTTTTISSRTTVVTTPEGTLTSSRSSVQSTTALPTSTIRDSSSNSNSSNVPVIVGSVVGIAAVIIIVATTFICFRRRRRKTRELTFDTLQGISASSRQRYNNGSAAGRASVTPSGFDDGYDYESQSNVGHAQGYAAHVGYGDNGYDPFGTPQQSYQNPSIFQEDSLTYAGVMGRNRAGYDQNLPEIMYRNGDDLSNPAGDAAGLYDDNTYNQQTGWNQDMGGHYPEPKGLWVANPTTEKAYQQEFQPTYKSDNPNDIELQQPRLSYEKNSINQYDNSSDTVVDSSSPRSKFQGHNTQVLPESPRTRQLRGGDLFGEDANNASSSPRSAAAQATATNGQDTTLTTTPPSSSPRLLNRGEMRSLESSIHSPPQTPGEGVQSYANDYAAGRPSMDIGPNKSLRTQRREDWS